MLQTDRIKDSKTSDKKIENRKKTGEEIFLLIETPRIKRIILQKAIKNNETFGEIGEKPSSKHRVESFQDLLHVEDV